MKPIEEAFASGIFRRVILPGIILAAGVHPLIATWESAINSAYGIGSTALLVIEVVFFGLIVSSGVQWIYYVYEGFRLVPLTVLAYRANKRRVRNLSELKGRLAAKTNRSAFEDNRLSKAYEMLLDFPVRRCGDGSLEYFADRPTRLGNIIATYELYPETRYGVDGVFYWFHLLNLAPESARKEFLDQYAFAESLVLTSFSGALVAVLHVLVLVGFKVGIHFHRIAFVTLHIGPQISMYLLIFGIAVWGLFYAAALPAHREARKIFHSIVDMAMPAFIKCLTRVQVPLDKLTMQRLEQVTRYLVEPLQTPEKK